MFLIYVLAALIGGYYTVNWLRRQPEAARKRAAARIALYVLGALVLLGVLAGRLNPMTLVVTALAAIPMLMRVLGTGALFRQFRAGGVPASGNAPPMTTLFLRMTRQRADGRISGTVLRGRYEGRGLDGMTLPELLDLLWDCRLDAPSVRLLESYLDCSAGPAWREEAERSAAGRPDSGMSVDLAREILGVGAGATRSSIIAAHRNLMQRLHPDRGGSTYLAAQVNRAKDTLLSSP